MTKLDPNYCVFRGDETLWARMDRSLTMEAHGAQGRQTMKEHVDSWDIMEKRIGGSEDITNWMETQGSNDYSMDTESYREEDWRSC